MKIKTTYIGIVMLSFLVIAKYVISVQTTTSKDGSFKSGVVVDYSGVQELIRSSNQTAPNSLLAYHKPGLPADNTRALKPEKSQSTEVKRKNSPSGDTHNVLAFNHESPATLPMEHANSLVVFDPTNPVLTEMKTQFVDQYDVATPLDNGNTLVNEMQLMMPRR